MKICTHTTMNSLRDFLLLSVSILPSFLLIFLQTPTHTMIDVLDIFLHIYYLITSVNWITYPTIQYPWFFLCWKWHKNENNSLVYIFSTRSLFFQHGMCNDVNIYNPDQMSKFHYSPFTINVRNGVQIEWSLKA